MDRVAVISGADRGLGLAMTAGLLHMGWRVFAGQYMPEWPELGKLAAQFAVRLAVAPLDVSSTESVENAVRVVSETVDHVDLLVNNAGITSRSSFRNIHEPQDYAEMHRMYDVNTLGPIRMVEAFLPLTDRGEMKRLCFISSKAGSVERTERTGYFGYCSSKTALNMAVKNMFNYLRPDGYTFRLYHPGWIRSFMFGVENREGELEPEEAAEHALAHFLQDQDGAMEDLLVMRDYEGNEWPWQDGVQKEAYRGLAAELLGLCT